MNQLYKGVHLKMSVDKFKEHKAAKGERTWEEYFDIENVRKALDGASA